MNTNKLIKIYIQGVLHDPPPPNYPAQKGGILGRVICSEGIMRASFKNGVFSKCSFYRTLKFQLNKFYMQGGKMPFSISVHSVRTNKQIRNYPTILAMENPS